MKELLACIFLLPTAICFDFKPQIILWNIGQGQFLTIFYKNECHHIDFGGEVFPSDVIPLCQHLNNFAYYSHEDKDHINFAINLQKNMRTLCLFKESKHKYLKNLPPCKNLSRSIQTLFQSQSFNDNNSNSSIFKFKNSFLFTGDATRASEKIWSHTIPSKIKYWTLPHHGSKTSTSPYFLNYIPHNSIALISARKRKYGHPHNDVLRRLRAKKIPALKTQDWGHIRILIN